MIAEIKTIDNVKQMLPIAGSQPSGNPVGSLLFTYRKLQPRNYLYCDGSTFNASQYPALALYLGGNVLPDYRECGVVGAEENTTDTIASHDVYTEGEFKDDQNKSHRHSILAKTNSSSSISNVYPKSPVASNTAVSNADYVDLANYQDGGTPKPYLTDEGGNVARGKRKAVFVYIKAVDGVDVTDEDTFLNTVKNYSDTTGVKDFTGIVFTVWKNGRLLKTFTGPDSFVAGYPQIELEIKRVRAGQRLSELEKDFIL